MNFKSFENDIRTHQWEVHGVEVYESDRLIYHYGDTETSEFPVYSATKTILSIALGVAWDEGKIELERPVTYYLPAEIVRNMQEKQKVVFQDITIERLLTMSVDGFPFRPEGESYLKYALSCAIEDVQNKTFHYSNIPAYLTGVALTNAVSEDLYQYMNRKLFEPLHIINPVYKRCPDSYFYGASGMELSVHDLSRIGLLMYHGGVFEGERIVSEEYVKMATSVQIMNREGGYGYFIWKYRDGFSINGKWGQRCYILPDKNLVVTCLSHMEKNFSQLQNSIEKNIVL